MKIDEITIDGKSDGIFNEVIKELLHWLKKGWFF